MDSGLLKTVLDNGGTLTNGVLAAALLTWAWSLYKRLVSGDLVPRAVHNDVRTERDLWREASKENQRQKRELIDSLEITQELLRVVRATLVEERSENPR